MRNQNVFSVDIRGASTPALRGDCQPVSDEGDSKKTAAIMYNQPTISPRLHEYVEASTCLRLSYRFKADVAKIQTVGESEAEVVLIDPGVTKSVAVQTAYLLKRCRPELTLVVTASRLSLANFVRFLQAGADGFYKMPGSQLAFDQTIKSAIGGWKPFPQEIGKLLANHVSRQFAPANAARLTQAEAEVLAGLLEGKRDKDIAADRGISHGTVHTITNRLYKKLDVHSRTELVQRLLPFGKSFALTRGLDK